MIYLVDNIGNETGVHLYNSMFYNNFKELGKDNLILSNYSDEHTKKIICNFYHGNKIKKIFLFIYSLVRLFIFTLFHKNDTFIYQSFGLRKIDQLFIQIIKCKKKYVLVHDIFDIKDIANDDVNKKKIEFYRTKISQIICHSERTKKDLIALGFKGKIVYFPHFRYNYDEQMQKYNAENVGNDVKMSIIKEKYNLLFFGQVRESKGIDVVLKSLDYLQGYQNLNVIVAGTDKQNLVKVSDNMLLKKVLRYINDDEMMYLYSHSDYILLPYKEVYQSGVMESMLYFKKPGIMSDVEYFKKIGNTYTSFGVVFSPNNAESLAAVIREVCDGKYSNRIFYSNEDVRKYNEEHDISKIITKEF